MDLLCNDWRARGTCVTTDLDYDPWTADSIKEKRFAQHLCLKHCPVLAECERDTRIFPYRSIVAGGVIWSDSAGIPIRARRQFVQCELPHPNPSFALLQVA